MKREKETFQNDTKLFCKSKNEPDAFGFDLIHNNCFSNFKTGTT